MADEKSKKSVALERRVDTYPPPKILRLIQAKSACDGISKSSIVVEALKEYFDRMPEQERSRITTFSKNTY